MSGGKGGEISPPDGDLGGRAVSVSIQWGLIVLVPRFVMRRSGTEVG